MLSTMQRGAVRHSRARCSLLRLPWGELGYPRGCASQCVEVEQKFRYHPDQEKDIARIATFVEEKRFEDIYYDLKPSYPLSGNDVWLRQRSGHFECKVPPQVRSMDMETTGGGVGHYEELVHERAIAHFLASFPPLLAKATKHLAQANTERVADLLREMGLEPFCHIHTRRRKYRTSDGLAIDLDSMDELGYHIGEVELMVPPEDVQAASKRIIDFTVRHGLDVQGPILGKVLYYIERYNADQRRVLQETGLFARKLGQ